MTTTARSRPASDEILPEPQSDQSSSSSVKFDVENLVDGWQLKHPVYDRGNLLLLAEGSTITPRFKQLLLARSIRQVMLNEADADNMAAPQEPSTAQDLSDTDLLESRLIDPVLTQKLDGLVDSGQLFKATVGASLKERLVLHRGKGHGVGEREALLAKHLQTCTILDDMVKAAVHGQPIQGNEIAKMVATYLTDLISDADCILDVVRRAHDYAAIADHCLQTSLFGMALAIEMEMSEVDVRIIGLSGLLHDWGMTRVPRQVLHANRVLTNAEFVEIKKHPGYTLDLLKKIPAIPESVPMICYQVHERPDGTGYPRGSLRSRIHPGARILHVADAYLALTSPRPFRKPFMAYAAVECLVRQASQNLVDADVVRALLHVVSLFPIGSLVGLSDGSTARVLRRNRNNYNSPIVQIVMDSSGDLTDPLDETQIIDPSASGLSIVKALPASDGEQTSLTSHAVH